MYIHLHRYVNTHNPYIYTTCLFDIFYIGVWDYECIYIYVDADIYVCVYMYACALVRTRTHTHVYIFPLLDHCSSELWLGKFPNSLTQRSLSWCGGKFGPLNLKKSPFF